MEEKTKKITDLEMLQEIDDDAVMYVVQNGADRKITYSALMKDIKNISIPSALSELLQDKDHRTVSDSEKEYWNNKSEFTGNYDDLTGTPNIPAQTSQLTNDSGFITQDDLPRKISELENDSNYLSEDHNTSTSAHNDIRVLLDTLTKRLNAVADSGDVELDQLSEIVKYIKENKTLIESVTTNKVNVTDIVDNLITPLANRPLSANQGVILKSLIDNISIPSALSELQQDKDHRTVSDSEKEYWNNKSEFTGNYDDLTGAPNIPEKTSQLTNDSGFITQDNLPKKVSELENDSNYLSEDHNTSTSAHNDIRVLLDTLTKRLNAVADSGDVELDQLSEIVEYIKSNKELLDFVSTNKVDIDDIVDDLVTTSTNKPLSANQGNELRKRISDNKTAWTQAINDLANDIRNEYLKQTDIIDALGSGRTDKPVSAHVADVLSERISDIGPVPTKVSQLENDKVFLDSEGVRSIISEDQLVNKDKVDEMIKNAAEIDYIKLCVEQDAQALKDGIGTVTIDGNDFSVLFDKTEEELRKSLLISNSTYPERFYAPDSASFFESTGEYSGSVLEICADQYDIFVYKVDTDYSSLVRYRNNHSYTEQIKLYVNKEHTASGFNVATISTGTFATLFEHTFPELIASLCVYTDETDTLGVTVDEIQYGEYSGLSALYGQKMVRVRAGNYDIEVYEYTASDGTITYNVLSRHRIGAIAPTFKTTDMTQEVGLDVNTGKLYTAPGGGDSGGNSSGAISWENYLTLLSIGNLTITEVPMENPIEFEGLEEIYFTSLDTETMPSSISQGDLIVVEFDGVSYKNLIKYAATTDTGSILYAGNMSIDDSDLTDTGEPFLIMFVLVGGTLGECAIATSSTEATHHLKLAFAKEKDPIVFTYSESDDTLSCNYTIEELAGMSYKEICGCVYHAIPESVVTSSSTGKYIGSYLQSGIVAMYEQGFESYILNFTGMQEGIRVSFKDNTMKKFTLD